MRMLSRVAVMAAVLVVGFSAAKADDRLREFGVAVYKMGEERATDKDAGPSFDKLLAWLGKKVGGATFVRRGIRNNADDALKLMQDDKAQAALAMVSPNFYFKNKDALKLTLLGEAQRKGFNGEQYVLIGATKAEIYPEGKKVATNLDDVAWLNNVVMPAPEGAKPVQWVNKANIFDALFDILDEEDGAPDFVLVDRITLEAVEKDKSLAKLPRGLKSELLPQDLVVEIDGRLGDKREAVIKALKALDGDDEGKKVGEAIQVPSFTDADAARLKAAGEKSGKGAK